MVRLGMLLLKLFDLVTKRIDCLALEKIELSPLRIVKSIAVQQHDEPFHFNIPNMLGKDCETFALEFAVCHSHVSALQRTQRDSQRALKYAPWLS